MKRRTGFVLTIVTTAAAGACGGAAEQPIDPLDRIERAFATAGDATGFEVRSFIGSTTEFAELGLDQRVDIDDEHPTSLTQVTNGMTHLSVDLSAMLAIDEEIGFEIWLDDDRMVVDTRDYALLERPGVDLGPFRPGVSTVELDEVTAAVPDLITAIAGNSFDLDAIARRLPDALDELEQTSSSPVTVTGKALWSDLMEAMGSDVDATTRSLAAGMAMNLDTDVDVLAGLYRDLYRSTSADVTIVFADDGTIESIEERGDMSSFWGNMVEHGRELGLPSTLLAQIRNGAADATMKVTTRLEFDWSDGLVITDPPASEEDRTDEWVALLGPTD